MKRCQLEQRLRGGLVDGTRLPRKRDQLAVGNQTLLRKLFNPVTQGVGKIERQRAPREIVGVPPKSRIGARPLYNQYFPLDKLEARAHLITIINHFTGY